MKEGIRNSPEIENCGKRKFFHCCKVTVEAPASQDIYFSYIVHQKFQREEGQNFFKN